MESRSHAIAAGLFVIILGAGVVLALWWFSDKREATRELVLGTSSSVNGLNPQATVRYRGIVAGKVAGIGLDPGNPRDVLVTVRIRADLPITQGTRARLPPRVSPGWPSSPSTTTVKMLHPLPAWAASRPASGWRRG